MFVGSGGVPLNPQSQVPTGSLRSNLSDSSSPKTLATSLWLYSISLQICTNIPSPSGMSHGMAGKKNPRHGIGGRFQSARYAHPLGFSGCPVAVICPGAKSGCSGSELGRSDIVGQIYVMYIYI